MLMTLKIKYWYFLALRPNASLDLLMFEVLDHAQRHTPVGGASLDERSVRRRYPLLDHTQQHNRQNSMPPAGFEPTISAGERLQTYALVLAATGTSNEKNTRLNILVIVL